MAGLLYTKSIFYVEILSCSQVRKKRASGDVAFTRMHFRPTSLHFKKLKKLEIIFMSISCFTSLTEIFLKCNASFKRDSIH